MHQIFCNDFYSFLNFLSKTYLNKMQSQFYKYTQVFLRGKKISQDVWSNNTYSYTVTNKPAQNLKEQVGKSSQFSSWTAIHEITQTLVSDFIS